MQQPRLDTLVLAVMCFLAVLIIVRDDLPIHEAAVDSRPIVPVKSLNVPMYVINLDRNGSRLEMFMKMFYDSDFRDQTVTRLPAIDGKLVDLEKTVAHEAMPALARTIATDSRTSHEQLTVGAVGCYLSHMAAWREVAKSGRPYGIVFEDDAEVGRYALRHTVAALRSLPEDWDILLLGTACLSKCPKLAGAPHVRRVPNAFVRFPAYLISRRACEFLASDEAGMLPMSMQVDWKISELAARKKLKVFTTRMLVSSGQFGTTVQRPVFGE